MNRTQPSPSHKSAFTLIELLVVIAIIAILAAILFPVFAQARDKARQTACINNEKQFGTAFLTYATDYDDNFPLAFGKVGALGWTYNFQLRVPFDWDVNNPPGSDRAEAARLCWANSIQPYVKNWDVYRCPSSDTGIVIRPGSAAAYAAAVKPPVLMSYIYNGLLQGINSSQINRPSEVYMLNESGKGQRLGFALSQPVLLCADANQECEFIAKADYSIARPCGDGGDGLAKNGARSAWFGYDGDMKVHTGGHNFLFADGHVKWGRVNTAAEGNYRNEPWSTYDAKGAPSGMFWDGCHGLRFSPKYEPTNWPLNLP